MFAQLGRTRRRHVRACVIVGSLALAGQARADLVISSDPTSNVACNGGACVPTAPSAVLNVDDLAIMLGAGNVTVSTSGAGVQATDLRLAAPLAWGAATALALDAHGSVVVGQPVQVGGGGGLVLTVNDGGKNGRLTFGQRGHVTYLGPVGSLAINGTAYAMVASVHDLAAAIAANPSGAYALAGNYDAANDGIYPAPPVPTTLTGSFSGLGNSIEHLTIIDKAQQADIAMFAKIGTGGTVRDIRLSRVNVKGGDAGSVGTLVGENDGSVIDSEASGSVMMIAETYTSGNLGGLIGYNFGGLVEASHANVTVRGGTVGFYVGGLIGFLFSGSAEDVWASGAVTGLAGATGGLVGELYERGAISRSFSTATVVSVMHGQPGGLVGDSLGLIADCYATGSVSGGNRGSIGGLIGYLPMGTTSTSYAIGPVSGRGGKPLVGGFFGSGYSYTIKHSYWDTTTSGTAFARGGDHQAQGVQGLTTAQLQSGLPEGFAPGVWGQNITINGGLPYLLSNPPE